MSDKLHFDSIGFDLDGTLWDGTGAIAAAWKLCMEKQSDPSAGPTLDMLKSVMGLPMPEILLRFFPDLTQEERECMMEERRLAEADYIREHGGRLFEPLAVMKETLEALSSQYKLFIVSNCQVGYIEAFLEHYGLESYFCDYSSWGATGLSKGKNIRLVMNRNGLQNTLYVGDTQGDYDAAKKANVSFLLAAYGFGSVNVQVDSIEKLSDLVKKRIC